MMDKIEFVIPIDEMVLDHGIDTLMNSLLRKREKISKDIALTLHHQLLRKQLLSSKITINNVIVKVSKSVHLDDLNMLNMDELEYVTSALKEDVSVYFMNSLTGEASSVDKSIAYDVMNVFKYLSNVLEIKNTGAIRRGIQT